MQKTFNQSIYFFYPRNTPNISHSHFIHSPQKATYISKRERELNYNNLKSATKPLKVLIAFTRPLITEFADNLNLKHPLLPTISPYPTM